MPTSPSLSTTPCPQTAKWWQDRFKEKFLEANNKSSNIELVLLGDSIMHAWEAEGYEEWQRHFAGIETLNLGFAGDRTEHVLWRIENGALEGISPKIIALLIGTNNIGHRVESIDETLKGIISIINLVNKKIPNAKVLLFAVFPRSKRPSARLRLRVNDLNKRLEETVEDTDVCYVDLTHLFLDEHGILNEDVSPDYLHLSRHQYKKWAEYIQPIIDKHLSNI